MHEKRACLIYQGLVELMFIKLIYAHDRLFQKKLICKCIKAKLKKSINSFLLLDFAKNILLTQHQSILVIYSLPYIYLQDARCVPVLPAVIF